MGIMLVYDITNQKSFNNVTNWLRNIDEHASEDVVRLLVGNKVESAQSQSYDRSRMNMTTHNDQVDLEDKRRVSKAMGEEVLQKRTHLHNYQQHFSVYHTDEKN